MIQYIEYIASLHVGIARFISVLLPNAQMMRVPDGARRCQTVPDGARWCQDNYIQAEFILIQYIEYIAMLRVGIARFICVLLPNAEMMRMPE